MGEGCLRSVYRVRHLVRLAFRRAGIAHHPPFGGHCPPYMFMPRSPRSDRVESALSPRSFWYWLAPALLAFALYAITVPGTYVYDDQFVARRDPRLYDPHRWSEFLHE